MNIDFKILYDCAKAVINPRALSPTAEAGGVGAALLTDKGNVYTGVCIDTACSLGMCAERAAAAAMVTAGENRIIALTAVMQDGRAGAPCGACREFLLQLAPENAGAKVLLDEKSLAFSTLENLMPHIWFK